ncbi:MAG TPA: DUF4126 domain-containing protein [Thermoleophilaceae bacterium]|nr:DUF4126 domain-containing protein [Thermoleophilaceae bacterium]
MDVLTGLGLSGAAGLNAWLPAFAGALLTRLGVVELGEPFNELSKTPALVVLGVLTVADFVGDKIPAVDHVLHSAGTVIAPISGTILFTGETDASLIVSLLAGGSTAGAVHAARSAVRPLSTVTTAGIGNPVLSLLEDLGSALLTLFAFVVPVLAVLAVVAVLVLGLVLWRRARRRRAASA